MFLFWQSKSFYHLLIGDVVKLKKLLHKSWSLTSPHPPLGFGSRSLKRDSPSMTTVLGKRCCLLLSRVASTCWTLAMGSQFLDLTCVPLGKKKRKNFCFLSKWLSYICIPMKLVTYMHKNVKAMMGQLWLILLVSILLTVYCNLSYLFLSHIPILSLYFQLFISITHWALQSGWCYATQAIPNKNFKGFSTVRFAFMPYEHN